MCLAIENDISQILSLDQRRQPVPPACGWAEVELGVAEAPIIQIPATKDRAAAARALPPQAGRQCSREPAERATDQQEVTLLAVLDANDDGSSAGRARARLITAADIKRN